MLINMRNGLMAGKRLPYDAEVEYLENNGDAYIDTGLPMRQPIYIDIEMAFSAANDKTMIGGKIDSSDSRIIPYAIVEPAVSGGSGYRLSARYGVSTRLAETEYNINDRVHVVCSFESGNQSIELNGSLIYTGTTSRFFSVSDINYLLFARAWNGVIQTGSTNGATGRIWHAHIITDDGERDFIPVRIGSGSSAEGAMLDRANPTGGEYGNGLYRNKGSGAFGYGNDT